MHGEIHRQMGQGLGENSDNTDGLEGDPNTKRFKRTLALILYQIFVSSLQLQSLFELVLYMSCHDHHSAQVFVHVFFFFNFSSFLTVYLLFKCFFVV